MLLSVDCLIKPRGTNSRVSKSDMTTASVAFARRLRELMKARGLVSESSRSGVDVSALAHAAGASYEMARRYAEGVALPRPDKLQKIADWLGVPASVLAWGTGEPETINTEALQQCIQAVIEAQGKARVSLTTERAAALVAALYQEAIDGRQPRAESVARMLRAMI